MLPLLKIILGRPGVDTIVDDLESNPASVGNIHIVEGDNRGCSLIFERSWAGVENPTPGRDRQSVLGIERLKITCVSCSDMYPPCEIVHLFSRP